MAPKVPKKGKPAPTSKKPVVRKDGKPTRAEKKQANKDAHKAAVASANAVVKSVVDDMKAAGKFAANEQLKKILGRPVEWSPELEKALFALISTGHGMREISEMEGMPPLYQMLTWLAEDTHPFSICRARAKDQLVPLYEETVQSMAMNTNPFELLTRKQVLTKDGDKVWVTERRQVDNTERTKIAIQTTQWSLGHLRPKKHGRSPEQTSNGPNEQLKGLFESLKAPPVDK